MDKQTPTIRMEIHPLGVERMVQLFLGAKDRGRWVVTRNGESKCVSGDVVDGKFYPDEKYREFVSQYKPKRKVYKRNGFVTFSDAARKHAENKRLELKKYDRENPLYVNVGSKQLRVWRTSMGKGHYCTGGETYKVLIDEEKQTVIRA